MRGTIDNLEFLAARLHGRHSQMAEGARLESICRLRTMPRFASEVLSGFETESATEVQRRLVQDLAREVTSVATQLASAGAELLRWLAVRFRVENIKVLLRGVLAGDRPESLERHLLRLPREFALGADKLAAAKSVDEFVQLLPRGPLRQRFGEAVGFYREEKRPFFFEAALDKGYFEGLLARAEELTGEDQELVKPLVLQEVDTFHLMLVARGKFVYRLEGGALLPWHVSGTGIRRERFAAMLADAELRTAASRALGRALDTLPSAQAGSDGNATAVSPADLEALAWRRFLRLAQRAFQRSHTGLAAVAAFVEMRRVEVVNLITLSEGIRARLPEEQIRARLIPRQKLEAAHV